MMPVIGKVPDNGKSRTAMGTVYQRIIDPVLLMLHVFQAFLAYSNIRTNLGHSVRDILTFQDLEGVKICVSVFDTLYLMD